MRLRLPIAIFLLLPLLAVAAPSPTPAPTPLPRSTSASKQFIIYHPDNKERLNLSTRADAVRGAWAERLGLADEWKWPIIILKVPNPVRNAPPLKTQMYVGDADSLKIQIDINDEAALKGADFELAVYRALLLEAAYRNEVVKPGRSFQQPPSWLIEGLFEDARARGEEVPAALYERLIEMGPPPALEAFLKQRPEMMDPTARAIYRAHAMGLLRALLEGAKGPTNLRHYISRIPSVRPTDAKALLESFPQLKETPGDLVKLWTLSLAKPSAVTRIEPLDIRQTNDQLELLISSLQTPPDPKKPDAELKKGRDALEDMSRTDAGRYSLKQQGEALLRLEAQSHPFFRPVVEEYRVLVLELSQKRRKGVDKRVTRIEELRTALIERNTEISDYMNWFEGTQLATTSGEFDDFISSKTEDFPRRDRITTYIDDVESSGWK